MTLTVAQALSFRASPLGGALFYNFGVTCRLNPVHSNTGKTRKLIIKTTTMKMWKGGLIYTNLKGSTKVKLWLKTLIKKVKYKKGLTFKKASFDTNLKPLKQK